MKKINKIIHKIKEWHIRRRIIKGSKKDKAYTISVPKVLVYHIAFIILCSLILNCLLIFKCYIINTDNVKASVNETVSATVLTKKDAEKYISVLSLPKTKEDTEATLKLVAKEKEEIEAKHKVVSISIEQKIENACSKYNVSYDIVLAIARLETGWFKSEAYLYGNNPGGLSINEVPIIFESIEEGVEVFVSNLANNYFAIGLDTPEKIGSKYCPISSEWSTMVRELMTQ